MRRKQLLKDSIVEFSDLAISSFENTKKMKGKWAGFFNNDNPIVVDYGCGRGGYITQLAVENPELNFLGLEVKVDRIVQACKKVGDIKNVRFASMSEANLSDVFEEGEVSRVMVNCPDPMENSSKVKKRLLSSENFKSVISVLGDDGEIWLKTDHRRYFEDALIVISSAARIDFVSCDFRNVDNTSTLGYKKDSYKKEISIYSDPVTEFEQKWIDKSRKFYVLRASVL